MSTTKRLDAILRGAFKGAPTPLKDIPKRDGSVRNVKNVRDVASDAISKIVAPKKKSRD